MQKKVDSARKSLAQAIKAYNAHMDDIRELENELQEAEKKKTEFEDQVTADSMSQGSVAWLQAIYKNYIYMKYVVGRTDLLQKSIFICSRSFRFRSTRKGLPNIAAFRLRQSNTSGAWPLIKVPLVSKVSNKTIILIVYCSSI